MTFLQLPLVYQFFHLMSIDIINDIFFRFLANPLIPLAPLRLLTKAQDFPIMIQIKGIFEGFPLSKRDKGLITIEIGARVSAVQQVEESLKKYITSDAVQIGDKLPTEKQLCSDFGVGRGTIREAIRLLQAKGLVEIRPSRGAFVLQKHEAQQDEVADWFHANEFELRDLNDIRTAIEPLAVKLAIQRCSNDEIRQLRDIHQKAVYAAQNQDIPNLARLDEAFHSYIFECARNRPLADINKKIVASLATFRSKTFFFPRNVQNFIPAHAAILEAFEKRDITMGQANMIAHLELVAIDLAQSTQSKNKLK